MQTVDLSINQVMVGRDCIYYTPAAREDLLSHIARMTARGADIYHTYDYQKDGHIIYGKSTLRRAFKFLIEEKILGLDLPKYSIDMRNIVSIGMDNDLLVLLRGILGRPLEQETLYIWRYGLLLQQIGVIEKPEQILDRIRTLIQKNPKFNLANKPETVDQDLAVKANRLLNKCIRAVFSVLENKEPEWLSNYIIDDTNNKNTILELPNIQPNSRFQDAWKNFKEGINH